MNDEQLLVENNVPLNVYLDGFSVLDFLHQAKLIQTHGGRVSPPSYTTLILSSANHSSGTAFLQFNIKWLHDTISHRKRQDVGKYLLPAVAADCSNEESIPGMNSPEMEITPVVEPEEAESPVFNNVEAASSSVKMNGMTNDSSEGKEQPPLEPCCTSGTLRPQETHTPQGPRLKALLTGDTIQLNQTQEMFKANNKTEEKTRETDSCSPNVKRESSSNECWRFSSKSTVSEKIPEFDQSCLLAPELMYTQSPNEDQDRRKLPDDMQRQSGDTGRIIEASLRNVRYSFEEDQKIVHWLIEKKAISRINGDSVWFTMEYDNILPSRDASSLKFRFKTELINKINQYTNDSSALEQFNAFKAPTSSAMECDPE